MRNNYWLSELPIGDPNPQEKWKKHPRLYDPVTIGVIGIGIALAGAAMSAISAIQQGSQAKKAASFKSGVALRNAREARAQAARDAKVQRKKNFLRLGAIEAATGASGLEFEGSPLDIFQSSVIEGELEVSNIIHKGELKASGFSAESQLNLMTGESAGEAATLNAAGAVIGGAGSIVSSFNSAQRLSLLQEALV